MSRRQVQRHGAPDGQREGGTMHMASIHHAEVRDYDFANRALALRQRSGLTQRELGAHLGVSDKAIQAWEGGVTCPGTERLKQVMALYLERGTLQAGREEEEATALWEAMRATARRRTVPFDPHWFAALRSIDGAASRSAPPSVAVVQAEAAVPDGEPSAVAKLPAAWHDWGEAPHVPVIQGRANELAALDHWVHEEHRRLVLVLGEGGVGKTTLVARLAHDLAPAYAAVHWRSLRTPPPPEDWLAGAIAALSVAQALLPKGVEARLRLLLDLLRTSRCLLVLDNLDSVLEPGVPYVRYRAGYEGYGEILQRLGESAHQGCLLVTSREQPVRADQSAVRTLRLHGLGVDEVRVLLRHHDLAGDEAAWEALVARYAGNPRALQVAGETINTVFGGNLAAFLAQDVVVFGEIRQLLDEQVARLSVTERAVLTWLAQERMPVGVAALVSHLCPVVERAAVVEAVEALVRRALLERRAGGTFTLCPVVLQYVTAHLVERDGVAGQASNADGVGRERPRVQVGACGRAPARWAAAWSGTSVAGLCAGQRGYSPAAVRRPDLLKTSRRFGRASGRMAGSVG